MAVQEMDGLALLMKSIHLSIGLLNEGAFVRKDLWLQIEDN